MPDRVITPEPERRAKLEATGVPASFLDAIDSPTHWNFESILRYPKSCYHYLDTISSTYSILRGYDITPICDGANGDSFWVLLSNDIEKRFVHFELETDEIYSDYGDCFVLLLADLAILIYESADGTELDDLVAVLESIGFDAAKKLIDAVADADNHGLRQSFGSDDAWRSANIPRIIEHGGQPRG